MRQYKLIATAYPNAASNTSLTSVVPIPGEFDEYAILVPAAFANTATCSVRVLGAESESGTFYDISYSNPPSTATCSLVNQTWQSPASAAVSGAFVLCEALRFVPGYAKFQYQNTATAHTGAAIKVFARMG